MKNYHICGLYSKYFIFFVLILIFYIPCFASAVDVKLQWNESIGPDITGYRLYCREGSHEYDYSKSVWKGAETSATITGMQTGINYYFVVRAINSSDIESCDSNEEHFFIEAPVYEPPVANAGPDQTVFKGETVTLDGSNSFDPDSSTIYYCWNQTSGPEVTLSDTRIARPVFSAPDTDFDGESLTFELFAIDEDWLFSKDSVIINVTDYKKPPVADAGPDQTVDNVATVTLDGSESYDPDDDIEDFVWIQTAGPVISLSDPYTEHPFFTVPDTILTGTALTFQLTVSDSDGLKSTDSCIVNITLTNDPPVADAGDAQMVNPGAVVILDGSGSYDPDDDIVEYQWSQIAGPSVTLSNPSETKPSFTAPEIEDSLMQLTFQLTVSDKYGLRASDSCLVDIIKNDRPVTNPEPGPEPGPEPAVPEPAKPDPKPEAESIVTTVNQSIVESSNMTGKDNFTEDNSSGGGCFISVSLTDRFLLPDLIKTVGNYVKSFFNK